MKTQQVSIDKITVLEFIERPHGKVQDDTLRKSIEKAGIQQPLVLLEDANGDLFLVDGLRRLRIARVLSMGKVPAVIDKCPDGVDPQDHIRRLRFILDQHRQDLTPTQRAELIERLKKEFKMNHKEVAHYLGIAPDSVTNWLAVKQYIEPVRQAMDSGKITMHAARSFDGMTKEGQEVIWSAHASDLFEQPASVMHKRLRQEYSPKKHPEFYRNAEFTQKLMSRGKAKRQSKARPTFTPAEKNRLSSSLEIKEIELRDGKEKMRMLEKEIEAAVAPIAAIIRNPGLWAMVPQEIQAHLERFAEVYI